MKTYIDMPEGAGPCVKQTVTATIVARDGSRFVATNYCLTPQTVCARAGMKTGEGYELCKSVCSQPAHAEVNAIRLASSYDDARFIFGSMLYLEGHSYACDKCTRTAMAAGIAEIVIGAPKGS